MENKSNEQTDIEFGAQPKPQESNLVRVKTGSGDFGLMSAEKAQKLGLEIHPQDAPPEMQQAQVEPDMNGVVPASSIQYTQQQPQPVPQQDQQVAEEQAPQQTEMDQAYAVQMAGIAQAQAAGVAQGARDAGYFKTMSNEMEKFNKEKQERDKEFRKKFDIALVEVNDLNDKINNFEVKDYWADKSTGQKIMAAIALGLGAYGSARTGGPNQAMQIIDNAIARDLNMQKTKLAKLEATRDAKKGVYQMLFDQYKNEDVADSAALTMMLKKVELDLQRSASLALSDTKKAGIAQMIGQIQEKRLLAQQTFAIEKAKIETEKSEKLAPRFVPAFGQVATTKEGAAKVKDFASSYFKIEGGLEKLENILEKGSKFNPTDRAAAKVVVDTLVGALRLPITGPGAFTKEEQAMVRGVIGDPREFLTLDSVVKEKIKGMRNYAREQLFSEAEAEGLDVTKFDALNAARRRTRKGAKQINFQRLD